MLSESTLENIFELLLRDTSPPIFIVINEFVWLQIRHVVNDTFEVTKIENDDDAGRCYVQKDQLIKTYFCYIDKDPSCLKMHYKSDKIMYIDFKNKKLVSMY
jgi:hypothetical protein